MTNETVQAQGGPGELTIVPPGTSVLPPKPKAELVAGEKVLPIIPRTIEEVARIARAVITAGLAPDSYSRNTRSDEECASKIMIGILKGAEIGLAPLTALANIAIINGRPCLWGDGAVALVQASGKVANWEETYEGTVGTDDYTAVCKIWRRGQEEPYGGRFSIADARRARLLTKGPWVEYQSRMLMWRARSYAMRTGFADTLSGLSIAEEAQDLAPAPTPVNTAFLEDATSPAVEAVLNSGLPDIAPAQETAQASPPTGNLADLEELDGYIEALAGLEAMGPLREMDAAVKKWISESPERFGLSGTWATAKLAREKILGTRKTGPK